jgi:hypothetical protein
VGDVLIKLDGAFDARQMIKCELVRNNLGLQDLPDWRTQNPKPVHGFCHQAAGDDVAWHRHIRIDPDWPPYVSAGKAPATQESNAPPTQEGKFESFTRNGALSCDDPDTQIEFTIDDNGSAHMTRLVSNDRAVRQLASLKDWQALQATKNGNHMLILESPREGVRLWNTLSDSNPRRAFFFTSGDERHLRCQVLVASHG